MRTLLTHLYNEEYLLPWWLEHHKKYFDFGICIDYASTDRSVEIIKDICPHWLVFPSKNQHFDAADVEYEIEFYERQIQGWRMCLTVTEFLVGSIDKLFVDTTARMQWYIPGIRFTEWNPNGRLDNNKPLWEQLKRGVHHNTNAMAHQCRSLHNFNDIKYPLGRHFLPHNTEDACIFHYAHCIVGEPMIKRRLQIQHKINKDKITGLGNHHYFDKNGMDIYKLEDMHKGYMSRGETDCSETIIKHCSI